MQLAKVADNRFNAEISRTLSLHNDSLTKPLMKLALRLLLRKDSSGSCVAKGVFSSLVASKCTQLHFGYDPSALIDCKL
jgi:hypothetical protein